MSTRLVILGLLRMYQPLHGYELKHIIEEAMGDWTSIAFGSIYFALRKLAEEGFIEKVATEKEGGRPSRDLYQITKAGQEEFLRLLRQVWSELERHYYSIDIGLMFMQELPAEEIQSHLQQRVAQLEAILQHVAEHRDETLVREEVPRVVEAIFDHGLAHFQTELDWIKALLEKIRRGEYP